MSRRMTSGGFADMSHPSCAFAGGELENTKAAKTVKVRRIGFTIACSAVRCYKEAKLEFPTTDKNRSPESRLRILR